MTQNLSLFELLILNHFQFDYRKEDGAAAGAFTGVLDLIRVASGLAMLSLFLNQLKLELQPQLLKI